MTQIAALLKPRTIQTEVTTTKRTRKIVINACHGGFGLSPEAIMMYSDLAKLNLKWVSGSMIDSWYRDGIEDDDHYWWDHSLERDDKNLVKVVEALGDAASGWAAELKIVEIPADVVWTIAEYDGLEWVAEAHRTWS